MGSDGTMPRVSEARFRPESDASQRSDDSIRRGGESKLCCNARYRTFRMIPFVVLAVFGLDDPRSAEDHDRMPDLVSIQQICARV